MRKIGKRGDTTDWTGKNIVSLIISIIGIIVIILVVYGIVKFFFITQDDQNAENFINDVYGKINLLEDGENNTFLVRGVEGWYLFGWSKAENPDTKPDECFFDSCICICKPGDSEKKCDSGICKTLSKETVNVSSAYSTSTTNAIDCIPLLTEELISLEIIKNKDSVEIFANKISLTGEFDLSVCRFI